MIPWQELMKIGFLKLHLTPEVFWNMTFKEFQVYLDQEENAVVTREELNRMIEEHNG